MTSSEFEQNDMASRQEGLSEICNDHDELRDLLHEIQERLAKRLGTVARVTETLADFCDVLERHFSAEEIGGFFDEILEREPQLTESVEAVKADHTKLREAIQRLLRASSDERHSDWWEEMERSFKEFSRTLMKHEQAERQLLFEAYWQDSPAQD